MTDKAGPSTGIRVVDFSHQAAGRGAPRCSATWAPTSGRLRSRAEETPFGTPVALTRHWQLQLLGAQSQQAFCRYRH